jgi:hypothetical protein
MTPAALTALIEKIRKTPGEANEAMQDRADSLVIPS